MDTYNAIVAPRDKAIHGGQHVHPGTGTSGCHVRPPCSFRLVECSLAYRTLTTWSRSSASSFSQPTTTAVQCQRAIATRAEPVFAAASGAVQTRSRCTASTEWDASVVGLANYSSRTKLPTPVQATTTPGPAFDARSWRRLPKWIGVRRQPVLCPSICRFASSVVPLSMAAPAFPSMDGWMVPALCGTRQTLPSRFLLRRPPRSITVTFIPASLPPSPHNPACCCCATCSPRHLRSAPSTQHHPLALTACRNCRSSPFATLTRYGAR